MTAQTLAAIKAHETRKAQDPDADTNAAKKAWETRRAKAALAADVVLGETKCSATTKTGKPCPRTATQLVGSEGRCYQHA